MWKPSQSNPSTSPRSPQRSFKELAAAVIFFGMAGLLMMLVAAVTNDILRPEPENKTKFLPCDCTRWKHKCCETCRCLELESE